MKEIPHTGELAPRPYARLLTMLSRQLIKNNVIALTELAKNSYDADASKIEIRIGNMKNYGKKNLNYDQEPYVEIEDDGIGMSYHTIKESWMNPASPNKYMGKRDKKYKTKKGRYIQGEKGIGRYAVFQIGNKVEIISKNDDIIEYPLCLLKTDLTEYDSDLIGKKENQDFLYFDELKSKYFLNEEAEKQPINKKVKFINNKGTLIRITKLNYIWNKLDLEKIVNTLSRLQSPFEDLSFEIIAYYDNEKILPFHDYKLINVIGVSTLLHKINRLLPHTSY